MAIGQTEGNAGVFAAKDGITSNTANLTVIAQKLEVCGGVVNDTDPLSANEACLKVADDSATGLLYTSTPSGAAMDLLGYTPDTSNTNSGKTYFGLLNYGDLTGAIFNQSGLNADADPLSPTFGKDGQFDRYCQYLAAINFDNRANWRRPTQSELQALYALRGDMKANYGWPGSRYWTSTHNTSSFFTLDLLSGSGSNYGPTNNLNASCVSEP